MSPAEKQRKRRHRKERKLQQALRRDRQRWDAVAVARVVESDAAGPEASPRGLRVVSYDISYDPIPHPRYLLEGLLSQEERDCLFALVNDDPSAAIGRLNALLEQAPDAPILLNWLERCHSLLGEHEKAEELSLRNYQRNPDYLFARIARAQHALARGELEQIPVIFERKFDLKLLYPERSRFHVTEYLGFASVMVEYYMRSGEHEAAEMTLETMEQIAPEHELICRLRDLLDTSLLLRGFRALLGGGGRSLAR